MVGDNLGVVLAISRCRASDLAFLVQAQFAEAVAAIENQVQGLDHSIKGLVETTTG